MQLHLTFTGEGLNLPISYQSILQGMIYRGLYRADPAFSADLHEKGRAQSVDLPKLFVFGRLQGPYRIRGQNILFPKAVGLEIRSCDKQMICTLAAGLTVGESLPLGHNEVLLTECRIEDYRVETERISVRTASPFAVHTTYEARKIFDEQQMRHKLLQNAREKWCATGHDPAQFALEIQWDAPPTPIHAVFKEIGIDAWNAAMTLTGSQEVLDLLYNTGLGAKNSQGFGLLDIR